MLYTEEDLSICKNKYIRGIVGKFDEIKRKEKMMRGSLVNGSPQTGDASFHHHSSVRADEEPTCINNAPIKNKIILGKLTY